MEETNENVAESTQEETTLKKKLITSGTCIKAIATGFVAYGLILYFVFNIIKIAIVDKVLLSGRPLDALSIVLPIILGIIGWFLMFLLCRLSTYDVLNDCQIKEEDKKAVVKGMKVLFVVLILVSLIFTLAILFLRIQNASSQILVNSTQNDTVFSPNFTKILLQRDIDNFELYRSVTLRTTFIHELFFIISIFSLGPFQEKMIDTYNKD